MGVQRCRRHGRRVQPLWLRLSLVSLLTGTITLVAVVAIHFQMHSELRYREFGEEGRDLLHVVSAGVLEPVITEDRAELETILQVLATSSRSIFSVEIRNEQDALLARWRRPGMPDSEKLHEFEGFIDLEGERFGRVELVMNSEAHDTSFQRNLIDLLISLVLSIVVIVLVLVSYVHFLVVLPVEKMSARLYENSAFRVRSNRVFSRFSDEIAVLQLAVSRSIVHARSNRRRNAELQEAKSSAEAASRAKSRFLSIMSHELQSPLSAVSGVLTLLRQSEMDDQHRVLVERAERAAYGTLDLMRDILEFAQGDEAEPAVQTRFGIHALLIGIKNLFALEAGEKGLDIVLQVAPDIPAEITGPVARLRQVLMALVSNAIKFTDHGVVRITVCRSRGKPDLLRFMVEDTGVGIASHVQQEVFREFHQADSGYDRQYGGSGLGLALARRIVTTLGGDMGVNSAPGAGSCFWFELGFAAVPVPGNGTGWGNADASTACAGPMPGLRVLLVDDSDANRMVAAAMLQNLGAEVTGVDSGPAAIEAIRANPFDLVLMDLRMPGMDGWEATSRIRELNRYGSRVPIVALTANTSEDDRRHSREAGMSGFLSKPVRPVELEAVLRRCRACGPVGGGAA